MHIYIDVQKLREAFANVHVNKFNEHEAIVDIDVKVFGRNGKAIVNQEALEEFCLVHQVDKFDAEGAAESFCEHLARLAVTKHITK